MRIDDTPGLRESRPLTHVEALDLERVPERLVVLGGGYLGLELAQAMSHLGSRVTVVKRNDTLIHREDPDVTTAVEALFRTRGSRCSPAQRSPASKARRAKPFGSTERAAGQRW